MRELPKNNISARTNGLLVVIFLFMLPISSMAMAANSDLRLPLTGIRGLAAMALEKTARARVALQKKDLGMLVQTLREEQLLLDLLTINSPAGEARSLLHYLKMQMTMEDNREALPDLLPLFRALNHMPPSSRLKHARDQLNQVKQALEAPDHAKALTLLDDVEKTLEIEDIDLPMKAATDELGHMLSKLEKDHHAPKEETLLLLEKNLAQLLSSAYTTNSS
jgi:signal transduction histidine kinase